MFDGLYATLLPVAYTESQWYLTVTGLWYLKKDISLPLSDATFHCYIQTFIDICHCYMYHFHVLYASLTAATSQRGIPEEITPQLYASRQWHLPVEHE